MQTATVVDAATVMNLRDLGGIPLGPGRRVAPGLLLRSGSLAELDVARDPAVRALGIETVVDLRTDAERADTPDRLPPGARLVVADVLAGDPGVAPARLGALLADPDEAERALGGGKAHDLFAETYRHMVRSPVAADAYRTLIETVAGADRRPLLFHCSAGKDRTGWGATILLLLAGASRESAHAEFVAVDPAVWAAFEPYVRGFLAAGGDGEIAHAIVEVRPAYLDAALDEMDATWGGLDGYLTDALRLAPETIERVRTAITVPA